MPAGRVFEKQVNWRVLVNAFSAKSTVFFAALKDAHDADEPFSVFIPFNPRFDVLAFRDWLHDDHLSGSFNLVGCFEQSQDYGRKISFSGLRISFRNAADAVLCRLAWGS